MGCIDGSHVGCDVGVVDGCPVGREVGLVGYDDG